MCCHFYCSTLIYIKKKYQLHKHYKNKKALIKLNKYFASKFSKNKCKKHSLQFSDENFYQLLKSTQNLESSVELYAGNVN